MREHPQRVIAVHAYLYIVPGLMSRYQDLITEHVNNLPVRTLLADPMSGSSQNESPPPYEDIVEQESKVLAGEPVLGKSKATLEAPSSESQVVKDAKKENLDNPNVLRKRKRS
ncbi:MAG: hypothetical protein EOO38_31980 [Cytophagaceae bacterium]|nr:MAG: hypothetical protein EOO38_31980 [Cytophagaceae bacterium]